METSKMPMNIALLLLLFSVCNPGCTAGACSCSLSDLDVTQTAVPSKVNVYAVTVENRCICTQANVKLACDGFSSSVAVDPGVLSVDGKLCTLNGGRPIGMGPEYAVKFSYASPSQFAFKPVSSSIACS
ncbi:uncharacterized protein [Zea mays]|uniref:Beta-13-N-Acetylglucosaminyltransferase family protein n=1 Tax=Zea mays TaxID=4577 RepID=A0A1D6HZL2_MAIZE|nr:uncharacterized protein LOC103632341 [Zea mays]ONM53511.1 Beta-13-N-Acetylglucosaminyltransferase family protein [Zea mays]|eukprot:XP_008652373.1 uncharacterized protein LOC103632341 [Zea mays]